MFYGIIKKQIQGLEQNVWILYNNIERILNFKIKMKPMK